MRSRASFNLFKYKSRRSFMRNFSLHKWSLSFWYAVFIDTVTNRR